MLVTALSRFQHDEPVETDMRKDHKVRCDFKTPQCNRCTQAGRDCRYGLRLSWPKPGDKRRSVKAAHSLPHVRLDRRGTPHLVNAAFWDIRLHKYLSSSRDLQGWFDVAVAYVA
jgi:hypothetical protein